MIYSRAEKTDVPALYAHQKEAVNRFKDCTESALFFEMGVGKSATSLAIAEHKFLTGAITALLIIAPNDVHIQWAVDQIPLWVSVPYDMQVYGGRGGANKTVPFDDNNRLHIVCVNIDTFSTPSKWVDVVEWANYTKAMIIVDEATAIKNITSNRTKNILYRFNNTVKSHSAIISNEKICKHRIILTGTPVTNGITDMWCMMEFLKPNFFGRSYYSFKKHFGLIGKILVNGHAVEIPINEDAWNMIKHTSSFEIASRYSGCDYETFIAIKEQDVYSGPYRNADELKRLIAPVSMNKMLVECVDMDEQQYIVRNLTMTNEQKKCYNAMKNELLVMYGGTMGTALNKITALIRLQQISSGFISGTLIENDDDDVLPSEITWIGKSNPKLDALYADVAESGKPVIIATKFTAEASRIYDDLKDKYKTCLITGWKRVGTIKEFQDGKYDVMVANIRAIARGHNLQNSHVLLSYSNTYSLEDRLQLEGRIFRLGQKYPCEYVDYVYAGTIDDKIIASLKLKKNLLDYVRDMDIQELA